MKKLFFFCFITLTLCFTINSFAQVNQDFTLVNNTGETIYKLFVAPVTDSESWGSNLLGNKPLKNGQSIEVSFDKSSFPDDCVWDLKVHKEGNTLSWFDIDLCRYFKITLHWDPAKGEGSAELE